MMKRSMKYVMTFVALFLFVSGAWADPTVSVIIKLNGMSGLAASPGEADPVVSNGICTLTVTPADGNYVTAEYITAYSVVKGDVAQGRSNTPGLDVTPIEVHPENVDADPSGTTTYTFYMPEDASDVEVTVNFQSCKTLTAAMVTVSESLTYNGSVQTASVTVKDGEETLTEDVDYTVSDDGGMDVGDDYVVTVYGMGRYQGTVTKSYAIVEKELTLAMVADIADQTFTGSAIEPEVTVTDGDVVLTLNEDYELAYTDNTNIGTAKVSISGIGNYTGTVEKEFTIVGKVLTEEMVDIDDSDIVYDGSAQEPAVTVTDGQVELELNTDYTVSYSDNTNAGTATATITGKGNYGGTVSKTFTIGQADLSMAAISEIAAQTYTGSAIEPAVTVKFNDGTVTVSTDDYTVSYSNNTNVGEATVTVTSTNKNFAQDTKTSRTFQIVAAAATISGEDETVTYNGAAQAYSKGSTTNGTLVVTYYASSEDRSAKTNGTTDAPVNAGTYYVQLTLSAGNYTADAKDATFTISPAAITEVTLAQTSLTYNGTEQTVEVASVKAGELVLTPNDYEVSGNKGTDPDEYTVTVTAKANGNFTGSKTATFTIGVKALTEEMVDLDDGDIVYDGTAQEPTVTVTDGQVELELNTDYTVAYSDNTNAGTATATITGKGNYSGTVTKTFTIGQANLSGVTIAVIPDQTYTGSPIEPVVSATYNGLAVATDEYTVSYSNNTNAGLATVTLTSTGKNFTGTASTTFTIINRTLNVDEIAFAEGQSFASYYSETEDLELPEGLVAYIVTGVNGSTLTTQAVSYIPKNVAVLLELTDDAIVTNDDVTDNILRGTSEPTPVSDITGGSVYVLYNSEFVKAVSGIIPAHRCYLVLDDTAGARLTIGRGETDAVKTILVDATQDGWYDLNGRKLQDRPLKKGMYLQNGRKVVIK